MVTSKPERDAQAAFAALGQQYLEACQRQYETSLQLLNAVMTGDGQRLLALQGKVISDYMSGCLQCWSQLGAVAQQSQSGLMRFARQPPGRATRSVKKV